VKEQSTGALTRGAGKHRIIPAKKRLHIWKEKFKPGNWSTSANGFVFSNDEISRRLGFDLRLAARIACRLLI